MYRSNLDVRVDLDAEQGEVRVAVADNRAEVVRAFDQLPEGRRDQVASTAWQIGALAVQQAHGLAMEARLEDIGRELLGEVDGQLSRWTDATLGKVGDVLGGFFDPKSGELHARIERFVADDGELAALLRSHVASENSVLAHTLAARVGESSPLFRLLDPEQADGLVSQLEGRLQSALDRSRLSVADALNPRIEGSPVHQLLVDLRQEILRTEASQEARLKAVAAQLDANDEGSLLSQLVRRTRESHEELRRAVNPEQPGSPLAVVRDSVVRMVREAKDEQRQLIEASQDRQQRFQDQVLQLLTEERASRQERSRGPGAGRDFEDEVGAFVTAAVAGAPVAVDATGHVPGKLPGRKVGDLVLTFTGDSAFAGAGLVVEIKRDASYTVAKALRELEVARANRGCGAGLLILAATHAREGYPRFARYGSDVLVTWDPADEGADPYLHAALQLGLALAARETGEADEGDLEALSDIEVRIQHELRRLDAMEKHCGGIRRSVDKLEREIGVARKKLGVMTSRAQDALRALDAAAARRRAMGHEGHVQLSADSLEQAQDAVGADIDLAGVAK